MSEAVTYSREYLQAMPEKRKRDMIESYITNNITNAIITAAGENKTSYLFQITNESLINTSAVKVRNAEANNYLGQYFRGMNVTIEDFILAFQKKFPDCKVAFVEKWIETPISLTEKKNVLKSGIEIDWS
jgi:hypothetical protein